MRGEAKAKMWMNPEVPGMTVKGDLDFGGDTKKVPKLKESKIAK